MSIKVIFFFEYLLSLVNFKIGFDSLVGVREIEIYS